jgi:hypothetical protein
MSEEDKEEILAALRVGHVFWGTLVPWLGRAVGEGVFGPAPGLTDREASEKDSENEKARLDDLRREWEGWVRGLRV